MAGRRGEKQRPEYSWERQPTESSQAYAAFSEYLSMENRSITKVARKLNKSRTLIGRWSSDWKWQQRCRDYDNELKRQEFGEAQKAAKAMQKRQSQIAMLMQSKALKALEQLDPENLTTNDIIRLISTGAELERTSRHETNADRQLALSREMFEYKRERDVRTNIEFEDLVAMDEEDEETCEDNSDQTDWP